MEKEYLTHRRPHWKTHIGFLLAAMGSAIGLGNIWEVSLPVLEKWRRGSSYFLYFSALNCRYLLYNFRNWSGAEDEGL